MVAVLNRRSDQTRTELMSAFSGLVFAKGFENVTVKEIIASAGIARSTFYEHFSNKEDVLRACMTRFFGIIADCASAEARLERNRPSARFSTEQGARPRIQDSTSPSCASAIWMAARR